jgi:hypothetical protein
MSNIKSAASPKLISVLAVLALLALAAQTAVCQPHGFVPGRSGSTILV